MAVTFDAANLVITLESAVTSINAADIYSDWKDWVSSGVGSGIVPAFRVVGGDPVTASQNAGSYFFLRNDLGWRVRPPEEDIQVIINGNFVLEDSAGIWRLPTIGNFNTGIDRNFSALTTEQVINTGSGVTPQDILDIAAAVLAAAAADPINSNIKEVNDLTVSGTGTEQDPWGP